jgi:hypothetical protein
MYRLIVLIFAGLFPIGEGNIFKTINVDLEVLPVISIFVPSLSAALFELVALFFGAPRIGYAKVTIWATTKSSRIDSLLKQTGKRRQEFTSFHPG